MHNCVIVKIMKSIIGLLILMLLGSCVSIKKLAYVQDPVEKKVFKVAAHDENSIKPAEFNKIKPNDELIIKVSSFDDLSFNYFGIHDDDGAVRASNELSINAMSYSVDVNGMIYFPVIGEVEVADLTLEQARRRIRKELIQYFNEPNVSIKFAYKKLTVVGEVNRPGYYTYTKDQINLFEALALAGDLTIHGNRKAVMIIRVVDNQAVKYEIDLTDDAYVFDYNYYLRPDDILYVKPRASALWRDVSVPISLLFSTITTVLLVYNALKE